MTDKLTKQVLDNMESIFPNYSVYWMKLKNIVDWKKKYFAPVSYKSINEAMSHNDMSWKMCLFFSPNWEYRLSWNARKVENCKNIFCFFSEIDVIDDVTQDIHLDNTIRQSLLFMPSLVVRSKKWFHCYWLLDEPIKYSDNVDRILKEFVWINGWDNSAADFARILRLPWSVYRWDNEGIVTCDVIHYDPLIKYSLSDINWLVNKIKWIEKVNALEKKSMWRDGGMLVDDINHTCDVVSVLERLAGRWRVNSNWSVEEDWKITSWYKWWREKNCMVNFTAEDDYRPQWWPYQVARALIWNTRETFEFFEEEYGIIIPKRTQTLYKNIQEVVVESDDDYELTIEVTDSETLIVVLKWDIWTFVEQRTNEGIVRNKVLSWAIRPVWYYEEADTNYYVCYYKTKSKSWYMVLDTLWTSGKIDKVLSNTWITNFYKSSHKYTKYIIDYIHSSPTKLWLYDKLGIYDDIEIFNIWKKIFEHENKKHFLSVDSIWERAWTESILIEREEWMLSDLLSWLERMYDPRISITAFTWFWLSLFSYFVRKYIWYFPILQFVWLTQSGKTTLRRSIMWMYSLSSIMEVQATVTEFVLMKLSKHYIPVCITEFENAEASRVPRWSYLKNNYDGSKNSRWTITQNLVMYESNAPICLDWEVRTLNNAVFSRTIALFMNPKMKKELFTTNDSVLSYFIDNKDNIRGIKKAYATWKEKFHSLYKDNEHSEKDRILENYALLCAFADCFNFWDKYCQYIVQQCESQFWFLSENNIDKLIKLVFTSAIMYKLAAYIDRPAKTVNVEFYVDVMKVNQAKIDDIKSQIQLVNSHFDKSNSHMTDVLVVPMEYIMGNKPLHNIGNKMFSYITRSQDTRDFGKIKDAMIEYANQNGYTKENFYHYLTQWY